MASNEFARQVDRVAELLAQRAKRKLGQPPELRLVVPGSGPDEPESSAPAPALPDPSAFQPVDVSPRAQKMHAIAQIANQYGWRSAITHFLMTKGVPYMSDLTDPQLDDLHDRMLGYIDAAEMGACLPDCLPAT